MSLRNALFSAISERKESLGELYGIENFMGILGQRTPSIYIPYNENNPRDPKLSFGSKEVFSDESKSLKYMNFIVSVLRSHVDDPRKFTDWNHTRGVIDYSNYRNFLDEWIPEAMEELVNLQRKTAIKNLEESYNLALVIEPGIAKFSGLKKLDILVQPVESMRKNIPESTGFVDWDDYVEEYLTKWDEKQKKWLDGFSINRHAVEGDKVKKALARLPKPVMERRAIRIAKKVQEEFRKKHPLLDQLKSCDSQESFQKTIADLIDLVLEIKTAGQFLDMDTTATKFKNKIAKLLEVANWVEVKAALDLYEDFSEVNTISTLQKLNVEAAGLLEEVLDTWKEWKDSNQGRIQMEIQETGADIRIDKESDVGKVIIKFGQLGDELKVIGDITE